jgi:uncharacterized Zn finger protein
MKRGRPRRFQKCPECGSEEFRVYKTEQAGHCQNVYCECPVCGKLRYVAAEKNGRWVRVRTQ